MARTRSANRLAIAAIAGAGLLACAGPVSDERAVASTSSQTVGSSAAESSVGTSLPAVSTSEQPMPTSPSDERATETLARPAPAWLGSRPLPTTDDGRVPRQTTPEELRNRSFETVDVLPPPQGDAFVSTVARLSDDVVNRSTWKEGCPVAPDQLRYLTMSFWGFDGLPHTGEMIVHEEVADDIVEVFGKLYAARFPIEEMRVVTEAEIDAPPLGDGNNTTAFVCRPVVGGSSTISQHAYGLAIDVNPFHNPYRRGELVLPELSTDYLDRSPARGVIVEGDVVVAAFDAIGWGWGGRWRSLVDYQHFSRNGR